jgi:hypothetical protein
MTNFKKITLGVALAVTSLAVSVAQAQGNGNGRRGDRRDRGRGGHGGQVVASRRVVRLADQALVDVQTLSRIVRNRSMSQGMRGPARRALQDLQYVKQDLRQLKRVAMRGAAKRRLKRLLQQTKQDARIAVQTINRVRFVSRRAENRAANTIDSIRFTVQKIQRVINDGRGGRDRYLD